MKVIRCQRSPFKKFTHGQRTQYGHRQEQGKGHSRDKTDKDWGTKRQGHKWTGTETQTDRDRDTDGQQRVGTQTDRKRKRDTDGQREGQGHR